MESESCRAARSADSFTRLASSAPLKPGVRRASSSAGAGGEGRIARGRGWGGLLKMAKMELPHGEAADVAGCEQRQRRAVGKPCANIAAPGLPTQPSSCCSSQAKRFPRTSVYIGCHRLARQIEVQDFLAAPHVRQRHGHLGGGVRRTNHINLMPGRGRTLGAGVWTEGAAIRPPFSCPRATGRLIEPWSGKEAGPVLNHSCKPTCRSKRPGRVSAVSSSSGRLVAAMTTMPLQ